MTIPIKKIADVCEVIAGQSPEGKYYNSDGNGMPFYQGKKEFGEKHIGIPTTWTTVVTKEAIEGDILMSVRAPVGPVNFATQNICIGRGLAAIRPSSEVNADYLFYFLKKHESEITGSAGAVFNSINKAQIGAIEIPVPHLAEQQQIVAILDEAFAAIDQAKANIEKNIANAKELFQSKLNEIFSQKGDGWEQDLLLNLTTKIGSGSTPRGGQESYKNEGISLIRSMNVHDNGFKPKNLAFIDDEQAKKLDNVTIEEGDVLLNITGASVARCCVVPKDYLPARVNQHVSIIRPIKEKIDSNFLHYVLTSKTTKDKLLGIGEQGATRQAITKAQIETFEISFPISIDAQQKTIVELNEIREKTERLASTYQEKLNYFDELKKSILKKAFSGELTLKSVAQ
jgi:type I restriction enzyme S subunit